MQTQEVGGQMGTSLRGVLALCSSHVCDTISLTFPKPGVGLCYLLYPLHE